MQQYIGFILEGNEYALPIMRVQEIIKVPTITAMPNAPYYVQGVSNLRGKIVPVINLKSILGKQDTIEPQKVVVVTVGKMTFGVLIDDVTGVINVEDNQVDRNMDVIGENGQIEGIAKLKDKLVILLNEKKIIPNADLSLFEDEIVEYRENGEMVEVVKKVEGMGGEITVKEVVNAKEFYEKHGITKEDPRFAIVEDIVAFMDAVANNDFDTADKIMNSLVQKGQADLFKEVGKVARKLNDSLKAFKESLDPRLKEMAVEQMPRAVDQLETVIARTEEAATKTMDIVEKYVLEMDNLANHIREIRGPEASVKYLKEFKNSLEDDLTEILTTQSFQDLTGQTIRKVIKLVGDLEMELVKLITTFGLKIEEKPVAIAQSEKVSQDDIDGLLAEFGF